MKIKLLLLGLLLSIFSCNAPKDKPQEESTEGYDIVVYGGTSAGVMAAYSAKMKGKSVLLIEPRVHLGGLSSSGLGETDIGNKYTVTGLSRNFYRRLGKFYGGFEAWRFEPHKAEKVFNDFINEAGVEVLYEHRIIDVTKEGANIKSITVENSAAPKAETNKTISGKIFIDASYEGDLLGRSGVTYTTGRESNDVYGETLNGVQIPNSNQFPDGIDPYVIPGDSTSGLVWGISDEPVAEIGTGDKKIQAYNYRLCLTKDPNNMVPYTRPDDYDSMRYELLRRIIKQRDDAGWTQRLYQLYLRVSPMPNSKTDINNKGGFSTDYIGASWEYPEATYERRLEIELEHRKYIEGLLYFLATDPAIPDHLKEQVNAMGWSKDEFTDNGHFPHQIYVREARRLVGDFVMTEHYCRGDKGTTDTIAMGAYNMDSHHGDRHVINGMVKNEGEVQEGVPPYPIAYGVMLPKKTECENLLVAACISASHIAYGSIRMEPVFMMFGQASGVAASMALDKGVAVQDIGGAEVQEALRVDPLLDGSVPEIELNNEDASTELIGEWTVTEKDYTDKYFQSFLVSRGGEGEKKAVFNTQVPEAGKYEVFFYVTGEGREDVVERASSVPVMITQGEQDNKANVDMTQNHEDWVSLGTFDFKAEKASFTVDATGLEGEVIADAFILQKRD